MRSPRMSPVRMLLIVSLLTGSLLLLAPWAADMVTGISAAFWLRLPWFLYYALFAYALLLVIALPAAENGFRLTFSTSEFPGYTTKLLWRRKQGGGNWYYSPEYDLEGWICPAMFKYFTAPPRVLFVKADPK